MEEVAFGCLPGFVKVIIAAITGVGLTVLCVLWLVEVLLKAGVF